MAGLLSGLKSTAFIQLQTAIDNAVNTAGAVYRSLGLLHKTSILEVRHEFDTLGATIDKATIALNEFPADGSDENQVLDLAPKGIAICAAIARTTASLESIPGPLSDVDGTALVRSYKEVESKVSLLFVAVNARAASVDQGVPGLVDHGLNKLQSLFQGLAQALSNILPPSISTEEVQGIHASIQGSVNASLSSFTSRQK